MSSTNSVRAIAGFLVLLGMSAIANDETSADAMQSRQGALPVVDIGEVLESVSKNSGKTFALSKRVSPEIVIGQLRVRNLDYPTLLVVLRNNDLAAVTIEGVVNVIPVDAVRQYPLPVLFEDSDDIADDEWVTRIYRTKNANAAQLVPILRPLLPREGHLAANPDSGTLIIAARYANSRRLARMIEEIDQRTQAVSVQ